MADKFLTISSPYFVTDDRNSILLTNENYLESKQKNNIFHTSLGDISTENLIDFCECLPKINFVDFRFKNDAILLIKTKIFLNYISHTCKVQNYHPDPPSLALGLESNNLDYPDQCLWVFGCSLSWGAAVPPNTVYHHSLGQKLSLPIKLVAKGGSSTRWSLLRLLNSNIKKNDIVIWQVTTSDRFSVKEELNQIPQEMLLKQRNKNFLAYCNNEQILFDHFTLVEYGIQYLREKNVKFCFFNVEGTNEDRCLDQFTKYPEYCYMPDWIVDLGDDHAHPGILSHQRIATTLYKRIINL